MKFTWEYEDIRAGRRFAHFSDRVYLIVEVDNSLKVNVGFSCIDLEANRASPTYTKEALAEMLNSQGCKPLEL